MDDEDLSLPRLVLRGASHGAALGLLVGGLEALPLGVLVTMPLGLTGLLPLVALAAISFGLLGFVVSFVVGWPIHLLLRRVVVSRALSLQLAVTALLLVGYLFGGFAYDEWTGGRAWAAAFLLALPVFLFVTTFLLSGRLYRMAEFGQKAPVGFWPVALGGMLLLQVAGVGLSLSRDTGGRGALPDDPRFVVIAVDGLRADLGSAQTPHIDRLVTEGAVFTQVISPTPDPAGAVAAVLTGLPPTTHRVLDGDDHLLRASALLSATLSDEGYAVGGFVSDRRLGAWRGFGYGFQTYDDAVSATLPGLSRQRVAGDVGRLLGLFPDTRSAPATVDAFLGWLDAHQDLPFFALVHLQEPVAPFEPHGLPGFEANGTPSDPLLDHAARMASGRTSFDAGEVRILRRMYQEEVALVDQQVGRILQAIDAHGIADNTVVVLIGTSGQHLGEHGVWHHAGLRDETVHVPMVLRVPGAGRGSVITAQTRLQDLYPTVLEHAEIGARHEAQAMSVLGFFEGTRKLGLAAPLLGRDADGAWQVGRRTGGMKYIRTLSTGQEQLYDLDADPEEEHDLVGESEDAVQGPRRETDRDARRAAALLGVPLTAVE